MDTLVSDNPAVRSFILSSMIDGVSLRDLDQPDHEWFSPGFWSCLGYERDHHPHHSANWSRVVHADDLDKAMWPPAPNAASEPQLDHVLRCRHAKGHTVWVRSRSILIQNTEGRTVRLLGLHKNLNHMPEPVPAAAPNDILARLRMARNALPESITDVIEGRPEEAVRLLEMAMVSLDKVILQLRQSHDLRQQNRLKGQ
ncbi:PAS domain-containing protein [Donghicola mangrovi]|uniref:PAS domain-containing protein n=1 Tax=Donghicola mangrovi TaxID=2729614 RepID=A0A850Q2R9_9RHOB|nr:PAS domain-containing protein [Donghicola mangrovi]NVO23264.1 PAS domain-containing protein [Donghicola mangrovi]